MFSFVNPIIQGSRNKSTTLEPKRGVEPRSTVYKTVALPLSYKGYYVQKNSTFRNHFIRFLNQEDLSGRLAL